MSLSGPSPLPCWQLNELFSQAAILCHSEVVLNQSFFFLHSNCWQEQQHADQSWNKMAFFGSPFIFSQFFILFYFFMLTVMLLHWAFNLCIYVFGDLTSRMVLFFCSLETKQIEHLACVHSLWAPWRNNMDDSLHLKLQQLKQHNGIVCWFLNSCLFTELQFTTKVISGH